MADYNLGTAQGRIVLDYDGSGVDRASTSVNSFRDSTGKLRDEMGRYVKGAGQAETASKSFGRSLASSKEGLQDIAMGAGVAGAVIVGGLGYATKVAMDFEKQISAIGAVSGANAKQLEQLRKKALDLGASTAFSASESALAMEELVKAGVPVAGVLNGAADAAVALAAAGGVELPKAAEIASNAMNVFSIKAQDMPKVADLIAGAANSSAISVEEFGYSLSQVGAVANLAGATLADTATAIALMGNAGIKGSDAGTSLKTMLSNLQPTTKKQIDLFKELGIITKEGSNQFYDAAGNLKSLDQVSGVLRNSLDGMSKAEKQMALEVMFGSDAIRAAAVLTKEGATGFREMSASIEKIKAADVAKTRLDNVAGAIEQMKGALETAAINIGTVFLPAVKSIATFIGEMANRFSQLDPKWQKFIAYAALAVGGLLLFVAAVTAVVAGAAAIATAIGGGAIAGTVAAIAAGVYLLVGAFAAAYARSASFRAGVDSLVDRLMAIRNTVKAAVMPVLIAMYNSMKGQLLTVFAAVKAGVTAMMPAFAAIGEFIQTRVLPGFKQLMAALAIAIPYIGMVAKSVLGLLIPAFKFIGQVLAFVIPLLLRLIGPVFSALISAISWLIAGIPKLGGIFRAVGNVLKTIGMIILGVLIAPFYLLWKVAVAVFSAIMVVVRPLASLFAAVFGLIATIVTTAFMIVRAIVMAVLGVVVGVIKAHLSAIRAIWSAVWKVIGPTVKAAFAVVKGAISTAVNFIRAIISSAMGFVKAYWSAAWNVIKAVASAVWNAIKSVVSAGVARVIAVINGIKAIVGKVQGFFNQLKAAASGGVGSLVSFVGSIPGKILGALGNLGSLLFSAGADIVRGLLNGLSSLAGAVAAKAREIASAAANAAKSALGIASPSKVFIKIGQYVGQGLIIGLTGTIGRIRTTANKMARLLYEAVDAKKLSRASRSNLQRYLNGNQKILERLATSRVNTVNQLKKANSQLVSLQKASTDLQANIAGKIREQGKIVLEGEAFVTPSGIINRVQTALSAAKKFQANIAGLIKRGVSKDVIRQIAEAGPTAGGAVAESLVRDATDAQIKQLNSMNSQLASSAGGVGKSVADNLYRVGIRSAQGLLKGLQSQQKAIEKQMLKIAESMKSAIKRALKIKSPSRVFLEIGEFVTEGLSMGILKTADDAVKAVANMSGSLLGAVVDPAKVTAGTIGVGAASGTVSPAAAGASVVTHVTVNAPQNMNPQDVAEYTARRVSFSMTSVLPTKTA